MERTRSSRATSRTRAGTFNSRRPSSRSTERVIRARSVSPPGIPRPPRSTKIFLLNPYDADLDISKKDDKRLFLDGCKGIPGFEFNGERNEIGKFQKLLKVDLDDCRLGETLEIATNWKAGVRNPETIPDIFRNNGIKLGKIKDHVDLI